MARPRGGKRRRRGGRGGRTAPDENAQGIAVGLMQQQLAMIPGDMSGWTTNPIPGIGFSLSGFLKGVLGVAKVIPGVGTIANIAETAVKVGSGLFAGGGRTGGDPFGGGGGPETCPPNTIWDDRLQACLSPRSGIGRETFGGNVVDGRYGPAEVPDEVARMTAICPDGMVLGDDDLCYTNIANSERKYPRGRAPLLTGGERNAITKAGQAARKMGNAKKDLEKLGLLKRPTRRAPARHSIKHP